MEGDLENVGQRGSGVRGNKWTECVAEDCRVFDITGNWTTAALDPGVWYSTVCEGGCRFMVSWAREEEKAFKLGGGTESVRGGQD